MHCVDMIDMCESQEGWAILSNQVLPRAGLVGDAAGDEETEASAMQSPSVQPHRRPSNSLLLIITNHIFIDTIYKNIYTTGITSNHDELMMNCDS